MEHITTNQMTQELRERLQNQIFDLIIIGGGSAGFSACIQAAEFHLKTLMINDGLEWGGTCVNVGCVPSKVFVRAGEILYP